MQTVSPAVAALRTQADLFSRHLHDAAEGRPRVILVDTGLYGTTRALVAEGLPDLDVSSALIARSFRPGPATSAPSVSRWRPTATRRCTGARRSCATGTSSSGSSSPICLPSARSTRSTAVSFPISRSSRLARPPCTRAGFCLRRCARLPRRTSRHQPARRSRQTPIMPGGRSGGPVVWPDREQGHALQVGARSSGFGVDTTWAPRPWSGPLGALRGSSMWREGEIARSGTPFRRPLLALVEAAYGARQIRRTLTRDVR